ncbi:hypothetical protein CRG98_029050 [Punica granatum]|uniref:Uncharacterized protein n=1 Tax=Punica granatum TaxID=22663 RepID=A0A2I0J2T3_PUNGR|nr:hypothetical protein CRG98_029050 [Punica granatum]
MTCHCEAIRIPQEVNLLPILQRSNPPTCLQAVKWRIAVGAPVGLLFSILKAKKGPSQTPKKPPRIQELPRKQIFSFPCPNPITRMK